MKPAHLRRVLLVVAALVVSLPVHAGDPVGRPFLWKVQSARTTAWLLGSIHVAKADIYPLDRRIDEAFEKADVLVVEADAAGAGGLAAAGQMLARGVYSPPDTLEQHVPKDLFRETSRRMESYGLPAAQWTQYRPWLVAMTITMMELQSLGIVAEHGVDLHFLGRARGKKKILELESAEAQIDLLSGFDERQQQLFLEYTLRDVANLEKNFHDMFDAWRQGDARRLEELLNEPLRESKEIVPIYRKLLDERNEKMAEKIDGYLKTGETYFIVAGAAHLVGEKGLVRLLSRTHQVHQAGSPPGGVRHSIVR